MSEKKKQKLKNPKPGEDLKSYLDSLFFQPATAASLSENDETFVPLDSSTPRRRDSSANYEPEIKRLKVENVRLKSKIYEQNSSLAQSSLKLAEANNSVNVLEQEKSKLAHDISVLNKKVAGTKSVLSKKKAAEKKALESVESPPSKCFINIVPISECGNVFEGKINGQVNYFVRVAKGLKKPSEISGKSCRDRWRILEVVWRILAGLGVTSSGDAATTQDDAKEINLLLSRGGRNFFTSRFTPKENDQAKKMLSVKEAVHMQCLLSMTTSRFRNLRIFLKNVGFSIIPSEPSMRHFRSGLLKSYKEAEFKAETKSLKLVGKEGRIGKVIVLMAQNLTRYIEAVVRDLKEMGRLSFENYSDRICILFSGDKGGKHMKFHFEIVNVLKSTVFDVHMFSIYKGADDYNNIKEVLSRYWNDILNMQKSGFLLCGEYPVKIFLGGDYAYISACLGHQGASSTYPCSRDLVTLEHLRQNHQDGSPHTPNHCSIPLRTSENYLENYNENLARGKSELNKHGKDHMSVIGRQAFPILSLNNVVPAILHIKLGVVLRLFEMMIAACREIDNTVTHFQEKLESMHRNWLEKSFELEEMNKNLRALGETFVDFCNLKERFLAKQSGDEDRLKSIAYAENKKRLSKGTPESCQSLLCVMTCYDPQFWIECSDCKQWVHSLCDYRG